MPINSNLKNKTINHIKTFTIKKKSLTIIQSFVIKTHYLKYRLKVSQFP